MELRSLSKHNYGQPPFHTKDTVKEVDGVIKMTKSQYLTDIFIFSVPVFLL